MYQKDKNIMYKQIYYDLLDRMHFLFLFKSFATRFATLVLGFTDT